MRDILIFLCVFGALPFVLMRPYIGILLWSWLSYMNPHRLTWGAAYDFPFAQIVGLVTLGALLFSKEKKNFPITHVTVLWLLFVLWMNVSTVFALIPEGAWQEWDRTMKIQLIALITVLVMKSPKRIHALIWVIVASIGFYGVKGGIFSILTGGDSRVYGPPGSFIEDNNAMGLAMVMVLPLIWYLASRLTNKYFRWSAYGAFYLTALSSLTTHSRGALVAMAVTFIFIWLRSRRKLLVGLILVVAAPFLWMSMPQDWHERMATIAEYEQDGSAMGRINAWHFAFNLAVERPLVGGGFQTFDRELFRRYAPDPEDFHDSHSIYFEVLGEHGFVGLFLFLALGFFAFRTAGRMARRGRDSPEDKWVPDLAAGLQVSMVGYAVGGLFLGLAYFDLYYHIVGLIVLLQAHFEAERKVGALNIVDAEVSPPPERHAGSRATRSIARG